LFLRKNRPYEVGGDPYKFVFLDFTTIENPTLKNVLSCLGFKSDTILPFTETQPNQTLYQPFSVVNDGFRFLTITTFLVDTINNIPIYEYQIFYSDSDTYQIEPGLSDFSALYVSLMPSGLWLGGDRVYFTYNPRLRYTVKGSGNLGSSGYVPTNPNIYYLPYSSITPRIRYSALTYSSFVLQFNSANGSKFTNRLPVAILGKNSASTTINYSDDKGLGGGVCTTTTSDSSTKATLIFLPDTVEWVNNNTYQGLGVFQLNVEWENTDTGYESLAYLEKNNIELDLQFSDTCYNNTSITASFQSFYHPNGQKHYDLSTHTESYTCDENFPSYIPEYSNVTTPTFFNFSSEGTATTTQRIINTNAQDDEGNYLPRTYDQFTADAFENLEKVEKYSSLLFQNATSIVYFYYTTHETISRTTNQTITVNYPGNVPTTSYSGGITEIKTRLEPATNSLCLKYFKSQDDQEPSFKVIKDYENNTFNFKDRFLILSEDTDITGVFSNFELRVGLDFNNKGLYTSIWKTLTTTFNPSGSLTKSKTYFDLVEFILEGQEVDVYIFNDPNFVTKVRKIITNSQFELKDINDSENGYTAPVSYYKNYQSFELTGDSEPEIITHSGLRNFDTSCVIVPVNNYTTAVIELLYPIYFSETDAVNYKPKTNINLYVENEMLKLAVSSSKIVNTKKHYADVFYFDELSNEWLNEGLQTSLISLLPNEEQHFVSYHPNPLRKK
jgi:hypothetical protein